MRPEKHITTLIAPGAISDQAVDILKSYYEDIDSVILFSDGVRVRRDEEDVNTFYVCCPSSVSKKIALEATTYVKSVLAKNGILLPNVIFLPEGIEPKSI